ncbi:MAG TPA: class I SAM-dependent methyltransferase, partial [Acidimicrobiales bacterium]|nr:class I SAM-dependent methyltransferase [Acidimicrobiales bacterium]
LMEFVGKVVGDCGALLNGALVVIGDKVGLFRAMAGARSVTPTELAGRAGCSERYVREWLSAMAAGGYVEYDGDGRFSLPEVQAIALTDETSPAYVVGAFQAMLAATRAAPKMVDRFQNGEGLGWHEHDVDLFQGTERFFRPGYEANLVAAWLPALDGVTAKLEQGAKVADVGCGRAASTIIMARAYPNSSFFGFDYHPESIEAARKAAADAGVADRCTFEVASAKEYPGVDYDLVCHFDCLHDMGDPVGAASHTRSSLKSDGTWMLVEPYASDDVAENLNPVGRVFYSASTIICTPASLSQEVGAALGAQAGEGRLREVAQQAGFSQFRRATETPFNLVLEGRP